VDEQTEKSSSWIPVNPSLQTLFGRWVNFHVLRDADGIYLIDAGFISAVPRLHFSTTSIPSPNN
jgi:hypothetical protein